MTSRATCPLSSPNSERTTSLKPNTAKRPNSSSGIAADRLGESESWHEGLGGTKHNTGRKSVFREIGLENDIIANDASVYSARDTKASPALYDENGENGKGKVSARTDAGERIQKSWYAKLPRFSRPVIRSTASAPPTTSSTTPRVVLFTFLIAVVVLGIRYQSSTKNVLLDGASAEAIGKIENRYILGERTDSPISICTRWSHQSVSPFSAIRILTGYTDMIQS
jgi:hypothetical protein